MNLEPTATHLPVWKHLFKWFPIKTVLEFGCGLYSTKEFSDRGCDVTAIEMQNKEWHDKVRAALPNVLLHYALGPDTWRVLIPTLKNRYDLIFVDGHGDSRPDCMMWAKGHTDLIVAHDTEHPYYQWDRADMRDFDKFIFDSLSPTTTLWVRRSSGNGWSEMDGIGQWRTAA